MKKFLTATMIFCVIISSTCFATINKKSCAIGGIQIFSSPSDIMAMYGEPDRIESKYIPNGAAGHIPRGSIIYTWHYGNSFELIILDTGSSYYGYGKEKYKNLVLCASSSANNGLKTPDGVNVGMNVNVLYKVYGKPDGIYTKNNGTKIFRYDVYDETYRLGFIVEDELITEIFIDGEF